jgi:hypothetical protein
MAISSEQTFDDGSSLFQFDDGSTLITASDGTVSSVFPSADISGVVGGPSANSGFSLKDAVAAIGCDLGGGWFEKPSPAKPKYPYNNMTQTASGHTFEMDDTPGVERVRIQHRSETFLEMHPNGDEVHKIKGDSFEITVKNKHVLVEGVCKITINGDAIVGVEGNKYEFVRGNYTQVINGDFFQTVGGEYTVNGQKDVQISSDSSFGGKISLISEKVVVQSDLLVDREITALKITSKTRVDAGLGMSAGIFGYTTVGGLSCGAGLVAIPGCVTASVATTSPLKLSTMDITATGFGVFIADAVNTVLHNVHIHISPKGPTTPPIPPEMSAG